MKNHETLSSALDADLDRLGLTQAELATRLSHGDTEVLTEQAVSMWKRRNKIPRKRVKQIAEMFGPQSTLIRYLYPAGWPPALEPAQAQAQGRARYGQTVAAEGDGPSPLAEAIGVMFDSLPNDQVLRATVFGEVATVILNAGRAREQQSEPEPVRSRRTQPA